MLGVSGHYRRAGNFPGACRIRGEAFVAGVRCGRRSVVATDGTVTDGPYPEIKEVIGGLMVVDVPSGPSQRPSVIPVSASGCC